MDRSIFFELSPLGRIFPNVQAGMYIDWIIAKQ